MWLLSFLWFPGLEFGVRVRLCPTAASAHARARKNVGGMKADWTTCSICRPALAMDWVLPWALKGPVHPLLSYKLSSEKAELVNGDFFLR